MRRCLYKRDPAKECAVFGVLLVGETGSRKSALTFQEQRWLLKARNSQNHTIPTVSTVAGIPVALYNTPGMDDKPAKDRHACMGMWRLIESKKMLSINERHIKQNHIDTMRAC